MGRNGIINKGNLEKPSRLMIQTPLVVHCELLLRHRYNINIQLAMVGYYTLSEGIVIVARSLQRTLENISDSTNYI